MKLDWIRSAPVDPFTKGLPPLDQPLLHRDIGGQAWNVLREDLPFPVAVLRLDVMDGNRAWMKAFCERFGVALCPHGKTTMSPELFALQMADGAFGITCATASQLEVYRASGVPRVILANQLAGKTNLAMALRHMRDPDFELYVLADSRASLDALAATSRELGLDRPVQVLVEMGAPEGRTGVRSVAEAGALAARALEMPALQVAGLETYEGIFAGDFREREASILPMLEMAVSAAHAVAAHVPEKGAPFILSAGGSDYFDLVVRRLSEASLGRPTTIVLRGGCYLTHDSLYYSRAFDRLVERDPDAASIPGAMAAALEVWSVVQSRPEPGRAYVALGKRDISYDWELPEPVAWFRTEGRLAQAPSDWRVVKLNDQHLHMQVPPDCELAVGDLVGFGVSHPCTTFDKWRLLPIVNSAYDVVNAVRTFF